MLVNKNPQLIKTFADYIELDSVRAAYYVMLGAVAAHPHLDCYPENKGEIKDFRFYGFDFHVAASKSPSKTGAYKESPWRPCRATKGC